VSLPLVVRFPGGHLVGAVVPVGAPLLGVQGALLGVGVLIIRSLKGSAYGGLAAAPDSGPAVFNTVLARRLEPPLSRPLLSVRLRVTRILCLSMSLAGPINEHRRATAAVSPL